MPAHSTPARLGAAHKTPRPKIPTQAAAGQVGRAVPAKQGKNRARRALGAASCVPAGAGDCTREEASLVKPRPQPRPEATSAPARPGAAPSLCRRRAGQRTSRARSGRAGSGSLAGHVGAWQAP